MITKFVDGAGGNTLLTVLGVDRERYDVWVAGSRGGPLWQRAERHGIHTVELAHMRGPISVLHDILAVAELVRLIRRERFTIVHTHSSKAGFAGRIAAWLSRTPVVVHTIHGFSWHDRMSIVRRWVYLAMERLARPMTDAFLAVAPQVAREAVDVGAASPARTFVVPSAIELDDIPRVSDDTLRDELGIDGDTPLVGTVGRLDFQKAPLDFVRMAALLQGARPDARFVMVGEGELLEDARAESLRLGADVHFTGYRHDAARLAASFDVYVVSSLYEGLGRALCEAMASGRPVVACGVNGIVDLVEEGSTGLLAAPGEPAGLASRVQWLLDHPVEAGRMGRAGQARVRELFRPELMCTLIESIYARQLQHAR